MSWVVILPLILQNAPEIIKLFESLFSSPTPPTQAQWDELLAKCRTTATAIMVDVLTKAGIDPASPKGQSFLALVQ